MSFKPRPRRLRPHEEFGLKRPIRSGRKSNTCYVLRESRNGALIVFMPHPAGDGTWVRTDATVLVAVCPACGAKRFELCSGRTKRLTQGTHADRQRAAKGKRQLIYERLGVQHAITIDIEAAKVGECKVVE